VCIWLGYATIRHDILVQWRYALVVVPPFYYTHLLWRRRALSIPGLIDCSAKQHEAME
jgi:hypothetical protein